MIEKEPVTIVLSEKGWIRAIRGHQTDIVRLILEPKSRSIDPVLLMESMFKLTELETRFPLNMNVLSRGQVPNVLGLRQVLSLIHI